MDLDREHARLVRESGLLPPARVREALRRVGVAKSRGHKTGLLEELVKRGLIDQAAAARIRQAFETERSRRVPTHKVNVAEEQAKRERRMAERQRVDDASPRLHGAGTPALPAGGASGQHSTPPAGMPVAPAPPVALPAGVMQELREQARILRFASLVAPADLSRAMTEAIRQRQTGVETDLLAVLVATGRISVDHERAVRLKIYRDSGRASALQLAARPEGVSPPARREPAGSPTQRHTQPSAPPPTPPEADAEMPSLADTARHVPSTPPPEDDAIESPPAVKDFGKVVLHGLLDDIDDDASSTVDAPVQPADSSAASTVDALTPPPPPPPPAPKARTRDSDETAEDFGDYAVVRSGQQSTPRTRPLPSQRESTTRVPRPEALIQQSRDRALAMLLSESGLVRPALLRAARTRAIEAIAAGRKSSLARELLAAGAIEPDDLRPILERLYGEDESTVILPQYGPDGQARELPVRPPPARRRRPLSSSGKRPVPRPVRADGSPAVAPVAPLADRPPRRRKRSPVARADGADTPVAAPPPPPDGAKPVKLRDLTPRKPVKKVRKPGGGAPQTPRKRPPQRAPKDALVVKEVPALPPDVRDRVTPRPITDKVADVVGELGGNIGEDRFSVIGALGLFADVDLRDATELQRDLDARQRAGLEAASRGKLLDDPERLTDKRAKYLRIEEVARGGMGAIVRARDRDVRRDVAMKILEEGHDREKMGRFLEEAQITGQLEHPGIVPVHDVGLDRNGRLFFTMKLVKGESLARILHQIKRRGKRPARDAAYKDFSLEKLLALFLRICDAVAFAHSKGVIHRDLKPENIMVGEYGEVLVMDWGVAKVIRRSDDTQPRPSSGRLEKVGGQKRPTERTRVISDRSEDSALASQIGDITGTPAYMPPEQARGEVDQLDERTDVYALGAVLYEMLTLEPPFDAESIFVILRDVLENDPLPPRERAAWRQIPHELEAIIARAMHKSPRKRYRSVKELQDDVQSWVEGRRVGTVDYTGVQIIGKWAARHKPTLAAAVLVAVVALGLLALAWNRMSQDVDEERNRAHLAQQLADERLDDLERAHAGIAELRTGQATAAAEHERQRQVMLAGLRERAGTLTATGRYAEAYALLDGHGEPGLAHTLLAANAARLAYDPPQVRDNVPGRVVAAAPGLDRLLLQLDDRRLALFDIGAGALVTSVGTREQVLHGETGRLRGACDPAFRHWIVPARDDLLQHDLLLVVDLVRDLDIRRIRLQGEATGVQLDRSGDTAWFVEADPVAGIATICRLDVASGTVERHTEWRTHAPMSARIAELASDGHRLLLETVDGPAMVDTRTGRLQHASAGAQPATALALDPAGGWLVTATTDSIAFRALGDPAGQSFSRSLPTAGLVRHLMVVPAPTRELHANPDAWRLLAVTDDGYVVEWAGRAERLVSCTPVGFAADFAHVETVGGTAQLLLGRRPQVAVLRLDARLWPVAAGPASGTAMAVHPDRPLVAVAASGSRTLWLVDPDPRVARALPLSETPTSAPQLAFISGRDELLVRLGNTLIRMRVGGADSGREVARYDLPPGSRGPFVVPGDRWNFYVLHQRRVLQLELESGNPTSSVTLPWQPSAVLTLPRMPGAIYLASDDGRCLAWSSKGGDASLKRLPAIPLLAGSSETGRGVVAIPLSNSAASGRWSWQLAPPDVTDRERDTWKWAVTPGNPDNLAIALLTDPAAPVAPALIAIPSGRELRAGSPGHPPVRLRLYPATIRQLALTADGTHIAVVCSDGRVFVEALAPLLAAVTQ